MRSQVQSLSPRPPHHPLSRIFTGFGAVGSARRLGRRGRRFKSANPDHESGLAASIANNYYTNSIGVVEDENGILSKYLTKRHFIKDFEKKYKGSWQTTRKALVSQLRNVDMLVNSGRTNPPIHMTDDRSEWILKHEFVVAGLKMSRKSSGCRIIAHVNEVERLVSVLLVYHKDHLKKSSSETSEWEKLIKAEYRNLLEKLSF